MNSYMYQGLTLLELTGLFTKTGSYGLLMLGACLIISKGTEVEPTDPIDAKIRADAKLDKEKKLVNMEWKKAVKEWRQGEAVVKQQIARTIPDSLFMKIRGKGTMR